MPISVATPEPRAGVAAPLRSIVRRALAAAGARSGEIAIVLSDDAQLRQLNRRYRGLDRATDVLSFEYDGEVRSTRSPAIHGDLVISLDRMREQARRFRVSPGAELARLVVHGALHLAGHDHHSAPERREMRALENQVLRGCRAEVRALDRAMGRAQAK